MVMFDENAKKLLEARYLRKDEEGRVIESIPQMFERVAINIAIPSILYDRRVYGVSDVSFKEKSFKRPKELKIGRYRLNRYHVDTLIRVYRRLDRENRMLRPFFEIVEIIKKGEFDQYESLSSPLQGKEAFTTDKPKEQKGG